VEVLAIVERVVLFEDAILDQFLFFMQTFDAVSNWNLEAAKGILPDLELVFPQNLGPGHTHLWYWQW
jgi:hypothetical protein